MGQAHPNRTIEAQQFVVKDAGGEVRASFGMDSSDRGGPSLLLGTDGTLSGSEKYSLTRHGGDHAWLRLRSDDRPEAIDEVITPEYGPSFTVSDKEGYETNIGQSDSVKRHHTSAASLVMLGKDKSVLWSAP